MSPIGSTIKGNLSIVLDVVKYSSVLVYPITMILLIMYGIESLFWLPILMIMAISIADCFSHKVYGSSIESDSSDVFWKLPLWLFVPLQVALIFFACNYFVETQLGAINTVFLSLSTGLILGTFGITVAHDLLHVKGFCRFMAIVCLLPVNYAHLIIQHVFGHHVWVATPKDPSSAPYGMSLYKFFFKSVGLSYVDAWKHETSRWQRNENRKMSEHRMIPLTAVTILFNIVMYSLFGLNGYIFFLVTSFIGLSCLEVTNYLQHYGLERKKNQRGVYEPMSDKFAWNSTGSISRYPFVNMQMHGDHHTNPRRAYQSLTISSSAPVLPFSNSIMFMLALILPLFFRIMNHVF